MTGTVDSSDVSALIDGYAPVHVSEPIWDAVTEAIRDATKRATVTGPSAKKVLPVLASFGEWLLREGVVVDGDALGDLDLIERYVQTGMGGARDSTRATRRAILRRVARRMNPDPLPLPEPIKYRRVKPPYASWEIARFVAMAEAQPTAAQRQSVRALLALGLGCGLDRPDLAWVRGTDVSRCDGSVVVSVSGGLRPRNVVALDDYAQRIADCAAYAGDRLLIGGATVGRHNITTPALSRAELDRACPRLVPARLRSTWLVSHLNIATPMAVLLPAAGLASSRSLDDLLEYADPIDERVAAMLLRGNLG